MIAGVWIGGKGWTTVRDSTTKSKQATPTLADHTRIGSVTKTFTGTVILQLVDEGKVKLDEPIDRWFPTAPKITTALAEVISPGNVPTGTH